MRATIAFLAVTMLVVAAVPAVAGEEEKSAPDVEKAFTKARIAEKEGRFEEAVQLYFHVAEKWPENPEFTPKAYVHAASCLASLGHIEKARKTIAKLLAVFPKHEAAQAWGRRMLAHLDEFEAEKAEEERHAHHEHVERDTVYPKLEELERIWREQGVEQKEIEERLARAKAEMERLREARKAIEEARRRFRDMGAMEEDYRRRIEEMERRMKEMEEIRFRERHDRGMQEAREEFLRLAKRLGIPPEEVEGMLERHRRPGPERHFEGPEEFTERLRQHEEGLKELFHRLDEMEGRMTEIHHRFERIEVHLKELTMKVGAALEHGAAKMAEIEKRLATLEQEKAGK
jgi:tetratricopeptide (TPR) repeat protein